ncbi:type VII secretion integral membrane protein EccD [Mycobacterium sp. DSM 3803]|nr:type VII secretion integral membrane protein EccD [Mycobacterium sp. DSM 3803]OKH75610.1 hypothetical protein EB73_03995 [Mycobacterium sp. SWH-M3]
MVAVNESGAKRTHESGVKRAERVRLMEQVRVAVLFDGHQTDVSLPATTNVGAVVSSLVTLLRPPRDEDSDEDDAPVNAAVLTLARVDGSPLDREQTLAQQDVFDGDLLVLQVSDPHLAFTPITENASTAVAMANRERFAEVDEHTATMFAAIATVVGAAAGLALLVNAWRLGLAAGRDWNMWPAGLAAAAAVVAWACGSLIWWRRHDGVVSKALWSVGLVAATVAALMAAPGPPDAWHVTFAAATATIVGLFLWHTTVLWRGMLLFVVATGLGVVGIALLRAIFGIEMFYLWVGTLAVALLVVTIAPGLAGRIAAIPVPPFPTVTGKLTFEDADEIANEALVAAEHHGTPSVAELVRDGANSNTYLTALVASASVFFLAGAAGSVQPGQGRWWLATVYVVIMAAIMVLRGRHFTDRTTAVIVVATALGMVAVVALRYVLTYPTPLVSMCAAGGVAALGVLALIIAATVPARVFSPTFRKLIEYLEYVLIVAIPPLMVWLLNLIFLFRNR